MKNAVKLISLDDTKAVIGGLGVVFGGRDLEGETFAPDTDYMLDLVPAKMVLYDHAQRPELGHRIGTTIKVEPNEDGLWVEAELDRSRKYVDQVLTLVQKGVLGWSSGSVAHLARVDNGGVIKSWPIVEFSLTPTPAEPRTLGVSQIKALIESDPSLEALLPKVPEDGTADATTEEQAGATKTNEQEQTMSDEKQTPEAPAVDLGPVLDAIKGVNEGVKALGARVDAIEQAAPATNDVGIGAKGAPAVIADADHWRYDNVETGDLAFMVATLDAAKRDGRSRQGARPAAYKALGMRLESAEAGQSEPLQVARFAMKSAGVKANEINQSTLASYGDEWVGVAYSGALWESIRHNTAIVSMLPTLEVPAGAESVVIPLESTDPTWYKVAQASALSANPGGIPTNTVTSSNLGTANKTLTLAKMGARVLWAGELEEDAVLPYVAQLRRQLAVSGAEYLESAVIDGDTATGATTNINDIAGTPGGTEYWLVVNGFRKSCLVTTTANSRDGGALTSADFLETVKLMGTGGANADVNRTGFIIGSAVHFKALELADVKSRDVFAGATIESGRLAGIYGYPVYVSHHMHKAATNRLAEATGKIDIDTQTDNTTGSILAVRWDQWTLGWRRRMTLETTRVPAADSTEIVALMRFGLVQRDTEASAISYNITV